MCVYGVALQVLIQADILASSGKAEIKIIDTGT